MKEVFTNILTIVESLIVRDNKNVNDYLGLMDLAIDNITLETMVLFICHDIYSLGGHSQGRVGEDSRYRKAQLSTPS